VTWTPNPIANDYPRGVTYGNNTFVAVGETIQTSPDGVTWTPRPSGAFDALKGVAYGNNTFVAVGDNGIILQSDPLSPACQNNLDCTSGFYCAKAASKCDSIIGVCTEEPKFCSFLYYPVCGCDRTTYTNKCVAASHGASVAHEGSCTRTCQGFCGKIVTPGRCRCDGPCGTLRPPKNCCPDYHNYCGQTPS